MIIILSILISFITYELAKNNRIGVIRSSAIVTLIAYLVLFILQSVLNFNLELYSTCVFGASFVGMSCPSKVSRLLLLLASLIYSSLFISLVPLLKGVGGALGLSAFLSIFVILFLSHLIKIKKVVNE